MYSGKDFPFLQVGDNVVLGWDFGPDLSQNERILSARVICESTLGLDGAPSKRVQGYATIRDQQVFQQFGQPVAGERYRITFSVATSQRPKYERYSYLEGVAPGT